MSKPKIIFFGTPEVVVPILDSLKTADMMPVLIVTQPDRPQGRKMTLTPPPAKVWAEKNNIPVLQPEKLDQAFLDTLSTFDFELSLVVAYGKIMPKGLIELPKHKTINVHYSLLPKYRGATPVESAILNGDTETGIAIQVMQEKLDTGPIIAMEKISIDENETALDLRARLNARAAEILPETISRFVNGEIAPKMQDDTFASHCTKIQKEDGLIDPDGDAITNWRKYRAYFGWPGVFFFDKDGKRIKITQAHFENASPNGDSAGRDKFIIDKVIPEGKKETTYTPA